jgi:hypothetical protein
MMILILLPLLLFLRIAGNNVNKSSIAQRLYRQQQQSQPYYELPTELGPLTEHAAKHPEAAKIRDWIQHHGRFCCFPCNDGRTRCGCNMPGTGFVALIADTVNTITAFKTTQGYVNGLTSTGSGCTNPYRMVHP